MDCSDALMVIFPVSFLASTFMFTFITIKYFEITCWTDSLCFWMVPIGIFFGFISLGCVCGILGACLSKHIGNDDDEGDDLKEDGTIK